MKPEKVLKGSESYEVKKRVIMFLELYELQWGPHSSVFDLTSTTPREMIMENIGKLNDCQIKELVERVALLDVAKPRLNFFTKEIRKILKEKHEKTRDDNQEIKKDEPDRPRFPQPEDGQFCPKCKNKRVWNPYQGEWICFACVQSGRQAI